MQIKVYPGCHIDLIAVYVFNISYPKGIGPLCLFSGVIKTKDGQPLPASRLRLVSSLNILSLLHN